MNSEGNRVLQLGVYTNSDSPFVEFYDANGAKKLLVAAEGANGGKLSLNAPSGGQIVYLGPDDNTGDGLLNVMKSNGTSPTSYGKQ
jgi:hypothetical protein